MVSTYIDVTWFAPEEVGADPYLYDLDAVDYYHKLGLSKEKIKKILSARFAHFSEYVKLVQDISTYDPKHHKREGEIIVEQEGRG